MLSNVTKAFSGKTFPREIIFLSVQLFFILKKDFWIFQLLGAHFPG